MPLTNEQKQRLQSLYAGKHKAFLMQNHPSAYAKMERAGTLEDHLKLIGEEAARTYELLQDQMKAKAETIADPRKKTAYLDSIWMTVEEIVDHDIVYVL